MTLTFGSLFSGAGGLDAGFHNAGFSCRWQVELDRTCRSVLARHWPQVPRLSDVRAVGPHNLCPVDVIVGGFPCQNLSTAGNRAGLAGEKSGLWWEMLRVIRELRPRFVVWENVAGLLSSDGGRDLRRVCGSLAEHDYFGLVRTLDAQHFGVPQRRLRLFGVFAAAGVCFGDGGRLALPPSRENVERVVRLCAAVLAVGPGSGGDSPPRRKAGPEVAGTLGGGATGQGSGTEVMPILESGKRTGSSTSSKKAGDGLGAVGDPMYTPGADSRHAVAFGGNNTGGQRRVSSALSAKGGTGRIDFESETFIVHGEHPTAMTGNGSADVAFPAEVTRCLDSTGRGTPIVAFSCKDDGRDATDGPSPTLRAMAHSGSHANAGGQLAVAYVQNQRGEVRPQPTVLPAVQLPATNQTPFLVAPDVRRLTPTECERLMGWEVGWTEFAHTGRRIKDGPRYRMLGNGVVEPVARWVAANLRRVPTEGQ